MASRPCILTDWPWKPLGSFKYVILAPWAVQIAHSFFVPDGKQRDLSNFLLLLLLLVRVIHKQVWISYSRYRTAPSGATESSIRASSMSKLTEKKIGMIRYCSMGYGSTWALPSSQEVKTCQCGEQTGRYSQSFSTLAQSSFSTTGSTELSTIISSTPAATPITSYPSPPSPSPLFHIHLRNNVVYYTLFAIPMVTAAVTGVASVGCFAGYIMYLDLMNNMGHCNFEFIPKWVFSVFPPLKYSMYTPSLHSLHHTRFRTNYSLFMPFYDYIYGTMDVSTDDLHTAALKREEDEPEVVHLTHLTTPESIYHTSLGFAAFASRPYATKWFMWLMWPITLWSVMWNRIYGRTVVSERNRFGDLTLQTWIIPKYKFQIAQK